MKSTPEEIRHRFDNDVERFSNFETGQAAAIDSRLMMDLVAEVAASSNPNAQEVLDIGCGAGNYSLRLLKELPSIEKVTLIDLSRPMLDRAVERIGVDRSVPIQGDIRSVSLPDGSFDIVVAAAVLHHLRAEDEWRSVFASIYRSMKSGGSFWIADMVTHDSPAVQAAMWRRYGQYLAALKDDAYRDHVFAYIEKEDTPASASFQMKQLESCGFVSVQLLHKNGPFACMAAFKR